MKFRTFPTLLALVVAAAHLPAADTSPAVSETDDEVIESPAPQSDPALEKFWAAVTEFQKSGTEGTPEARAALQSAADQELPAAQVLLGDCLVSGSFGFKKDAKRGANLYLLAAERGSAYGMVNLGHCFASGTGVRRNDAKAKQWLTAALGPEADYSRPVPPPEIEAAGVGAGGIAGHIATDPAVATKAKAHYLLGLLATQAKDAAGAQAHFVAAAEAGPNGRDGIYEAAVQAALNYAFGRGAPRDAGRASQLLEHSRTIRARLAAGLVQTYVALKLVDEFAAAEIEEDLAAGGQSQSDMQFDIARQLADKRSKDYNPAEAMRWYELAADNGQVWAMVALAQACSDGSLGPVDRVKALHYLKMAGSGEQPRHYLAAANLGIAYLRGLGTAPDPAKANEIFGRFRDRSFLCYLGSIGQAPADVQTYEQSVELVETWARKRKDPTAQFFMGRRAQFGWDGAELDYEEAINWYRKASKARHPGALCALGELYGSLPIYFTGFASTEKAYEAAHDCFRQAAELGHAESLANLADHYSIGRAVPQNFDQAVAALERCIAIDPNHARAHNNLASIHEHFLVESRMGRPGDSRKMLHHYQRAAELNYPLAAANLGRLHFEGKIVPQDYQKAYRYFDEAAAQGMAGAHHQLGLMHELGLGVPITYTEAAYHYRLAALGGNVDALRRLIDFYLSGRGVSLDFNRAHFWLQRMVMMGRPRALLVIADIMLAKREYAAAVRILRPLTDSSDAHIAGFAHERLSRCYSHGWGVRRNEDRAKRHFAQAVAKGDGDALTSLALNQIEQQKIAEGLATLERASERSSAANYFLGQMHFFGTHVPQDKATGLKYMRTAAAREHVKAQYFLAAAAYHGEPDGPSLEEALRLAEKAELAGHPEAADLRVRLERRLARPATTVTDGKSPARSL